MNILPKKRWHVRTKDNIARVRRDEAKAAEEEQKRKEKLQLAESEARINFLRRKAGILEDSPAEEIVSGSHNGLTDSSDQQQFDLFADYKSHIKTTNKELEKEKKEEQEKYEKQVGYLTYLGQDTNEALKVRSWYESAPKRSVVGESSINEKDLKVKNRHDPLTLINALLAPKKKAGTSQSSKKRKHVQEALSLATIATEIIEDTSKRCKKEKKHKSKKRKHNKSEHSEKRKSKNKYDSDQKEQHKKDKLMQLRQERLRRESAERLRQEALLAPKETSVQTKDKPPTPRIVQKYNSQFNPDLAKQNML